MYVHGKKLSISCCRQSVARKTSFKSGGWNDLKYFSNCHSNEKAYDAQHCCKKHRKLSNKFTRKIFPLHSVHPRLLAVEKRLGIITAAVLSYRIHFPFYSYFYSACMLGATRKIVIMCIIERAFEEMRYYFGMSESSTLLSTLYDDMQVVVIVWNFCLF